MLKTGHNLKVLEKKIRQAVRMIDKLKEQKSQGDSISKNLSFNDLPLLKGLEKQRSASLDVEKLFKEREALKKRIQKMMKEIEKVIG